MSISSSDDSVCEVAGVGQAGKHSPPPLPAPDGLPPSSGDSDSDSDSSSYSQSQSTTSSSESDSSSRSVSQKGGQAEAAAGSVARAEPEEENPAGDGVRTVRRDRGFKWGDHFITPVGDDDDPKHYQITCGFSCHNIDGKCTKKRSVKFGGKDKVLLCHWASLGSACPDAHSHWKLWDSTVIPACQNNVLPQLDCISSDALKKERV